MSDNEEDLLIEIDLLLGQIEKLKEELEELKMRLFMG